MRPATLLLFLAALAAGDETVPRGVDWTPRAGSGWAGFAKGSFVKMKRSHLPEGRAPMVTVWTTTLSKAGKDSFTLETKAANAVGMEQTTTNVVPRSGEAGEGETQETEALENEAIGVLGREVDCKRERTTVTGPSGKRVITKWIAEDPKAWAKRTELWYDAKGEVTYRSTWLLKEVGDSRTVGTKRVACLRYIVLIKQGDAEHKGQIWTSRDVPGGIVRAEYEVVQGGRSVAQIVDEALDLDVK